MPVIPFTEWVPDAADFGNPGSITIKNALPGSTSYKPFSSLIISTGAVDAYPRGAVQATDASSNEYAFAGDETKLYELSGDAWGDVSKGGGYSSGTENRWEFARWREKIIATNFADNPQSITFGDTSFADLTTVCRFRTVAVVRDFVVGGYTFDGTDGTVRDRVWWSAQNDETDWTPSALTLSDFRTLGVGGPIRKIMGGEFGVILSEDSTFRLTFVGAPLIFQIDEVVPGVGSIAPGGVVRLGETIFYPSEHGFVALRGGAQAEFIGTGRVDQFFLNDFDRDYAHRVSAVTDPVSQNVIWAYPGAGNTNGRPNKLIVYNKSLNRWGYAEVEAELLWRSGGTSTTLEALDLLNLGPELVVNGDFAADANWTKGAGWTIAAGVATHAPGTASDLTQNVTLTSETYYRLSFDISSYTAGSVTPVVGGTNGTTVSAAGSYSETIRTDSVSQVVFDADSGFNGSIDNVSVKRINDLDSMTLSLDSNEFKGTAPLLAAFDSSRKSGNFSGDPYPAVFQTKESALNEGYRTRLDSFVPMVDGGTVTGRVGYRNRLSDPVLYTTVETLRDSGRFTPRVNAKYMRFELTASGQWTDAIGVMVDRASARKAERRG